MSRREPPRYLDEIAHRVIGAAIEVHRVLGPGFVEGFYESALLDELKQRSIDVERQVPLQVAYKGRSLGEHRLDLLVSGELVVELKAVERLLDVHVAQVISYLKAGSFQLGLLFNFNVPILRNGIRRVVNSSL